jgi:CubicO group peptidase (beta-lactamase class C family)
MRPLLSVPIALVAWLGAAGVPALGQQIPAPAIALADREAHAAITKARSFIRDTMRILGAPGASITVVRKGHVVWSEGFGFADVEQQVPVTALTRFRIGSVSKALTSVAIGRLVEEGKLDLDATVQRYVPSFPAKRWPITPRQLAGHLAGIRHYRQQEENYVTRHYTEVGPALAIFSADSLLFQPGTRFSYSSYGWNLLGAVIEGAGGQPYLATMQRAVFDPAEMRHTVADYVDSIVPNRARWYSRGANGGGIVNAGFADNSYKWAGGGFLSTTEDLAEFGDALLRGRLLRPETVKLLWTSQRTTAGTETRYGIGWSVETDSAGRRRISHGGGSVGGTAFLVIYPDQELVLALLVNSDSTFVGAASRIAEWFLADR